MAFVQIIDVIRWLFHRGPALRIEYRLCTTFNADMNYITIVYCGVSIYGYIISGRRDLPTFIDYVHLF